MYKKKKGRKSKDLYLFLLFHLFLSLFFFQDSFFTVLAINARGS